MGLFNFTFRKRKRRESTGGVTSSIGSTVQNAIAVSEDTAMKLSAVYACVRILSDTVAGLPLKYKRRNEATGTYVDFTDAPMYYALTVRPNSRMTAFSFWKYVVVQMLLRGNAYVLIQQDFQDVYGFVLLNSETVAYNKYSGTYLVTDAVAGVNGTFTGDKILHFRNMSEDGGYTGVSTISYARKQLCIDATAENVVLDRFGRGGIGKFVYRDKGGASGFGEYADEELNANGRDIERQLITQSVAVVRGEGELTQMQMTSADMQFIEQQKITVRAIGRFFGVHPSHLYEDTSNYKSVDAGNIALYSAGVKPILNNIIAELSAKLLDETNYLRYRFEFDIDSLYITDALTEADYITKQIANGTMTINEARQRRNLPPVEGGEKTLVSTNMADLNSEKITKNEQSRN